MKKMIAMALISALALPGAAGRCHGSSPAAFLGKNAE